MSLENIRPADGSEFTVWRGEGKVLIGGTDGMITLSEAAAAALADQLKPKSAPAIRRQRWSAADLAVLHQFYVVDALPADEIGRRLGRDPAGIYAKAKRLGYTTRSPAASRAALARQAARRAAE